MAAEVKVRKHRTGFCSNGQCEGTKPKGVNGSPMKTCTFWQECPCNCHKQITQMFEMAGLPRVAQDNPEYRVDRSEFVMPDPVIQTYEEIIEQVQNQFADKPYYQEFAEKFTPQVQLPPSAPKTYSETPSGRTAKGQLEDWVKQACDVWIAEKYSWPCTPSYLSGTIADVEKVPTPSTGAIGAVFNRWEELGFAVIGKKPIRFTAYTEEGMRLGLAAMKVRAKANRKRVKSEIRRGSLR
jgi:hypothetical protein